MGRSGGKSSSSGVIGCSSSEDLLLKLSGTVLLLSSVVIGYGRLTDIGGVVTKIGCLAVAVVVKVDAKFNLKGRPRLVDFTTGAATSKGGCCCCVVVVVVVVVVVAAVPVVLQILLDDDDDIIVVVVVVNAADGVVEIIVTVEHCLLFDVGDDPFKNSASM